VALVLELLEVRLAWKTKVVVAAPRSRVDCPLLTSRDDSKMK